MGILYVNVKLKSTASFLFWKISPGSSRTSPSPIAQSPETAYTLPGPFSHQRGLGGTPEAFCQQPLACILQGPPKGDLKK